MKVFGAASNELRRHPDPESGTPRAERSRSLLRMVFGPLDVCKPSTESRKSGSLVLDRYTLAVFFKYTDEDPVHPPH